MWTESRAILSDQLQKLPCDSGLMIEFHEQRVEQPHQTVPPDAIASRQCASDTRPQQCRSRRSRLSRSLWLMAWLLCAPPVFAQTVPATPEDSEINTDRPDFTESSAVVGTGVIQLEAGFTSGSDHADGVETNDIRFPQMLLRIGLAKRFELRVVADGLVTDSVRPDGQPSQRTSGYSAITLAGKYVLRQSDDGLALAVIPILAIPTGSGPFEGSVNPTVKLTWAHGLPAGFDVSGNINLGSVSNNLAPKWDAFWEIVGSFDSGDCACTFDTGVSHILGHNLELDVEAGWGLTSSAPDWFAGFGMGVRFPKRSHR